MARPNIVIINVTTQEEVVREMNDEEYAMHLKEQATLSTE